VSVFVNGAYTVTTVTATSPFKASATYSGGTSADCTDTAVWSSSDVTVAAVAKGGVVTPMHPGDAIIRATCGGSAGWSSVKVVMANGVYSQGTATVDPSCTVDLDGGPVCDASRMMNMDLWYETITNSERYVSTGDRAMRNGSAIGLAGLTAPGRDGCMAATLGNVRLNVDGLSVGTYLCARTNAGRYSQVRLEQLPAAGTITPMVVSYTTYALASDGM
jgi:hypothetical protein